MVAIVTGGSRGIGRACSLALSKMGYTVCVNFKSNVEEAGKTVSEIKKYGGQAFAVRGDVSDEADVNNIFCEAKKYGEIYALINNAGVSHIGLLQDMSAEEILKVIGTNLLGTVLCSKEAAREMILKKRGVIVNIASMWGEVGASCEAVYSASKAGVIGFTKALAKELGPSGIRVNCVSPGVIKTDMNKELSLETLEELTGDTPLLRLGMPEDVARAAAFLVREESSFITGQVLPVNGGITV